MVALQVDPVDDLGVADDEADAPAGHAERLRHRPHLHAHVFPARRRQEALGRAAVVDEVDVRGVGDDRGARALGVGDRRLVRAGRSARRARVRGVVEERGRRGRRGVEVGRPARRGVERQRAEVGAGERDAGLVVGIPRVGQQDRVAALPEREAELDDGRLRSRDDRHLAFGIDLDAVHVAVARGDRLARARQAAEGRIAVDVGPRGGFSQRLDHVRRRPHLGVAAAEIEDARPALARRFGDTAEEQREVLRLQSLEPVGTRSHCVRSYAAPRGAKAPRLGNVPPARVEPVSHWDTVYDREDLSTLSWHQREPARLARARRRARDRARRRRRRRRRRVSPFPARLLDRGFSDVTVVELAAPAIAAARDRLGERAGQVTWVRDDVRSWRPERRFDLGTTARCSTSSWREDDRRRYLETLRAALAPGGAVVVATFAPDGPETCSGLPVARYDAAALATLFGGSSSSSTRGVRST